MTLTDRSMEWLNQNRYRSYPMIRDDWREIVSVESGLDCILLDALVFDSDARGDETLEIVSARVDGPEVEEGATSVTMRYGGREFDVRLSGGETSGEGSFESIRGTIDGGGSRRASFSLVFSSHRYISEKTGGGEWDLGCKILQSRVICLSGGAGVDAVETMGSDGVGGHASAAAASGDVVLEDGYRTSPVIFGGKVLVRVGKRFGLNPCQFDFGKGGAMDCREPMFFFCGQNAINSGNVVLSGGKGISVTQGRMYKVRSGT